MDREPLSWNLKIVNVVGMYNRCSLCRKDFEKNEPRITQDIEGRTYPIQICKGCIDRWKKRLEE